MSKRKRLSPPVSDAAIGLGQEGWQASPTPRTAPPIADMAGASSAMAALNEVTEAMQAARAEGRMVVKAPLEAVDATYIERDRVGMDDEEMAALQASLSARGQQTPIEVVETAPGKYGLISGLRRLSALRALLAETGDATRFGEVLCLIRTPEAAQDAYVAMVEENEIRQGLSFYERARIAAIAEDRGVYADIGAALRGLYGAISRAKRSKIKSFVALYRQLDGVLRFPTAIPEHLGLALVARLDQDPAFRATLSAALDTADPADAVAERKLLDQSLKQDKPVSKEEAPVSSEASPGIEMQGGRGRVVLRGQRVDQAFQTALAAWIEEWQRRR